MTDPRLQPALQAALTRIQTTAQTVADRVADALGLAAMSATSNAQRQAYMTAQFDLRRKLPTFNLTFGNVLRDKVMKEVLPPSPDRNFAATDWESLSLVGDDEVEERVSAERLGMEVEHECEWVLRELAAYMGSLMGLGRADQERNPLRPELVGKALFRAIETTSDQPESRKLLARELSRALAQAMRTCYQGIVEDLRQRGVQPVGLAVKQVEGPGNELPREVLREKSAYKAVPPKDEVQAAKALSAMFGMAVPSGFGEMGGAPTGSGHGALGPDAAASMAGLLAGMAGSRGGTGMVPGAPAGARNSLHGALGGTGGHGGLGGASGTRSSDAQLVDVIRRLAFLTSGPGELGWPASGGVSGAGGAPSSTSGASSGRSFAVTGGGDYGGSSPGALGAAGPSSGLGALTGLMAANLIRQHRDELMRASTGALDHMVIDVVGALFDQVLSDPKVAPAMARQIARLQLPVLRVALKDVGFFSSRKHPVRRFVNRIASLAAAYDDFDDGPGREFLAKVRTLVQQIVEGDFDQMELYESKLGELETLIASQTAKDNPEHAQAAALLDNKETELRIQQRYMRELQVNLAPLALHDFVRDFVAQVWSQVQVMAATREGAGSPLVERMKRVPRDLVFSVQPKGTPQLRKEFLVKLPQLMKDLNEGLAMIRWPEAAKKDFFSKLLPAHAESLKGQPLTDFAQRQLSHQLDQVDKVPIPKPQDVARDSAQLPLQAGDVATPQFSPEEAQKIGLVDESAIDWDGTVDIDLDMAGPDTLPAELDINLDSPPPPTSGAQLIHHIQAGIAYQMHLDQGWKKVRLNWVSPGRAFFVFTHGKKHQKTVSFTSRMLGRMCETGRFKAFEQAELIERATARARKQLAALTPSSTKH